MNVVIAGDSGAVLPTLGLFDLVVTDPPFAASGRRAGAVAGSRRVKGTPSRRLREYEMTGGVLDVLAEAARHVAPQGRMVVLCGSSGRSIAATLSAVTPTLPLARALPWIKASTMDGAVGPFGWQTTLALLFGKCGGLPRAQDHHLTVTARGRMRGPHPAEMPTSVGRWLASALADPGMSVLDPFAGTGALVQGFVEAGCDVTAIDVEPRWAALVRARLDALASPQVLWPELAASGG